jgi:hypothetical protein
MATRIISRTWKVEGVLTNATSAKLSDPTGTYGVKRNDTDAVVVVDDTDMTGDSTGIYSYSFTDVANVSYTAYVEIIYDGATYYFEIDLAARSASSTLELTYSVLRERIADDLGWTRSSGNWSSDESDRLDSILHEGYLQFIYPIPVEGENVSHRWSFLKPTSNFDTVAETYLYDMPSDFGAIVGDLVYDEDECVHKIIKQTSSGMIDKNRASNNISGIPYLFALRPKTVEMTSSQVTELMLYPTPDAAYGIIYHYDAKVNPLSDANAYPLGGQAHSQTILQSCRDIAAARYKDNPGGREHGLFLERLKASVEADRRLSPKTLGFNEDGGKFTSVRHGTEFSVTMRNNFGV